MNTLYLIVASGILFIVMMMLGLASSNARSDRDHKLIQRLHENRKRKNDPNDPRGKV